MNWQDIGDGNWQEEAKQFEEPDGLDADEIAVLKSPEWILFLGSYPLSTVVISKELRN